MGKNATTPLITGVGNVLKKLMQSKYTSWLYSVQYLILLVMLALTIDLTKNCIRLGGEIKVVK